MVRGLLLGVLRLPTCCRPADFEDPSHFAALDAERARLHQKLLDWEERFRRPPSPKYVVLNFPDGSFLQVPEDMLQRR